MEPTNQAPAPYPPNKMSRRTILALWLLIAPTGLWIVVILGNILMNALIRAGTNTGLNSGGDMFASAAIGAVIGAVVLFIIGAIAFITWLPGLIIGIVLLATKPQTVIVQQPYQVPPTHPPVAHPSAEPTSTSSSTQDSAPTDTKKSDE